MIPVLAQLATPAPAEFGIWVGCLAAALWFVNLAWDLVNRFRPHPPSHEVYATKAELQAVRDSLEKQRVEFTAEVADLGRKFDSYYAETIKAGESRATKIHNRVNELGNQVNQAIGEIKQISNLILHRNP